MVLHGGDDAFGRPSADITASERAIFPQLAGKRIIDGAGHFLPHEKPEAVASALIDLLASTR